MLYVMNRMLSIQPTRGDSANAAAPPSENTAAKIAADMFFTGAILANR